VLLVLLGAACVFGVIAEDVATNDPWGRGDLQLTLWLHQHSVGWVTRVLLLITRVHSLLGVTVMTIAISTYLWIRRCRLGIVILVFAVFGGMLLNFLLKHIFVRVRPSFDNPILTLTTYSFPSGHTLTATVFYGALCVLIAGTVRKWHWRALAIALAAGMILLVGFSRIYLGAHYLSDVLAAMAEGLVWLAFCLVLAQVVKSRWQLTQEQ
jgi:undecaprenyl-diphosphatase